MSHGTASDKQQQLHLYPIEIGDEAKSGLLEEDAPVTFIPLMERVLDKENLQNAYHRVRRNKGSAGIDGVTVDDLPALIKTHWTTIRTQLLEGSYQPQAVKQVLIPKAGGGERKLGIPTVLDRLIQQALLQVLQSEWDQTFSHSSYGFRPQRSGHQAVAQSQQTINEGYQWVVDMDLEKFFDRVNHDKLMCRVKQRVDDKRILTLINRYLKAGAMVEGRHEASAEGTPQGGPLSPLLANLLLDDLDKELARRGLRFVRYADDCNIYVKSKRAGERVLASITRWLKKVLKLTVNAAKSGVDRPWNCSFLGFTFTRTKTEKRRKVSDKSVNRFKDNVRAITRRTQGRTLRYVLKALNIYLVGWRGYFGYAEVKSTFSYLDKWLRHRLRCYLWKQWGRRQYRELRKRGVERFLAWNTAKSAHGPWRISRSPALNQALPNKYFRPVGLTSLVV